MRTDAAVALCFALVCGQAGALQAESIREDVVQVEMPPEDITLWLVETAQGMKVRLNAASKWVEAPRLFLGDGAVAVELAAANSGIWLQGKIKLDQGDKLLNGSLIKVRPGYTRASELTRGDVYVTLPGVTFVEPGMLEAEWSGMDDAGQAVSLVFGANRSVKLVRGADVLEGTYSVAWHKRQPSHLDLDLGAQGKLAAILAPGRERLRIEIAAPGEDRPTEFTRKAVVLSRQRPREQPGLP